MVSPRVFVDVPKKVADRREKSVCGGRMGQTYILGLWSQKRADAERNPVKWRSLGTHSMQKSLYNRDTSVILRSTLRRHNSYAISQNKTPIWTRRPSPPPYITTPHASLEVGGFDLFTSIPLSGNEKGWSVGGLALTWTCSGTQRLTVE